MPRDSCYCDCAFFGHLQHKLHAFSMIVVFMDAFIFYVLLIYYDCGFPEHLHPR